MSALFPDVSTSLDKWLLDFEIVSNFHCWKVELRDVPFDSWGNTNLCCHCTREAGFFLLSGKLRKSCTIYLVTSCRFLLPNRMKVHFLWCHVKWKNFMQKSRTECFEALPQHFFLNMFALVASRSWRRSYRIFDLPVANAWGLSGGRFAKIAACFSSCSKNKCSSCFFLEWISLQDQGAPSVRVAQIIVQE